MAGATLLCQEEAKGSIPFATKVGQVTAEEATAQRMFARVGLAPRVISFVKLETPPVGRLVMGRIDGTLLQWFTDPVREEQDYPVALRSILFIVGELRNNHLLHRDLHLGNIGYLKTDKGVRLLLIDFGQSRTDCSCTFFEYLVLFSSLLDMWAKHAQSAVLDRIHMDEDVGEVEMKRQISLYQRVALVWIRTLWRVMGAEFPLSRAAAFPVTVDAATGATFHTRLNKTNYDWWKERVATTYIHLADAIAFSASQENPRKMEDDAVLVRLTWTTAAP